MAKPKSRTQRWNEAAGTARTAYDNLNVEWETLKEALSELADVQSEYQDWLDNLPENLQSSAVYDKLTVITDLDFEVEVDFSDVEQVIDEAEGADLPLGFGRD